MLEYPKNQILPTFLAAQSPAFFNPRIRKLHDGFLFLRIDLPQFPIIHCIFGSCQF